MIKGCTDASDRGIFEFDDLLLEMFESREDMNKLEAIRSYILKNRYDYCLVHLLTLLSCCRGYMEALKQYKP